MKSKGKNESEEGERKRQQEMAESVIGILLVLIMVASVIAMLTHSTSGSDITQTTIRNGYIVNPDNVTISINENTTAILIGQNVQFMCEGSKTGTVTATGVKGTPAEGYVVTSDSTGWLDTSMIVEGLYNATYDEHWELLAVQTPVMVLSLKVGTKEVSSICRGTPLGIDFTSNLDENDCVDLKVVDPTGSIIKVINNQKFDDINVSQLLEYGSMNESKQINTTGWRVGTYTFSVRTEEENARGLAMLSNTRTLVILKAEVDIVAEKTSVVELERVRLIIRGVCNHNITINSSDPAHTIFPAGYEDNPPYDTSGFNDTIDEDGQRRYVVYFNDAGTYTICVSDTTAGLDDTVDIEVIEKKVIFDVASKVVIGTKFTIKGTANTGNTVDIAVKDYVYPQLNDIVIKADGTFGEEIDTATANITPFTIQGSVRLDAYIDRAAGVGAIGPNETKDGSVVILMVSPGLTVELSTDNIAQGDDFTISGTAMGSTSVDIVVVAPKGSGGSLIDPGGTPLQASTNIYHAISSVSEIDYTFAQKIDVGPDVETGNYLVVVLSKGRDGEYGYGHDNLTAAIAPYNLTGKTQAQVLAILEDATVGVAGSDDLMWNGYINVILIPHAYLNASISKSTVPPGDSFEVYGTAPSDYVEIVAISPKGGNGTGMDGLYGVSIYTVPVFVGADSSSNSELVMKKNNFLRESDFIIIKPEVSIEAEKATLEINEMVNLTAKGVPNANIIINSSDSAHTIFPAGLEDNPPYNASEFTDMMDEDGVREYIVYFNNTGTYTITVTDITHDVNDSVEIFVMRAFYKKIKVDSGADTGNYTILVLSPGRDSVYGNSAFKFIDNILDLDGAGPEPGVIDVSNKTQHEIASVVKDVTINRAGSDDLIWSGNIVVTQFDIFDTGPSPNPYPSIFGTHNGTITPFYNIEVSKLYTYPCLGTGGHTEYIKIWNNSGWNVTATWNGYKGDWYNVSFNKTFTLVAGKNYNYTIRTGSYPQIHHTNNLITPTGVITCSEFVDANNKRYNDWIPAIRLWAE